VHPSHQRLVQSFHQIFFGDQTFTSRVDRSKDCRQFFAVLCLSRSADGGRRIEPNTTTSMHQFSIGIIIIIINNIKNDIKKGNIDRPSTVV